MNCKICDFYNDDETMNKLQTNCSFTGESITRYKCNNCGVIYGDLQIINLSKQLLTEEYKNLYKSYKEADNTLFEIELFHSLKPNKTKIYMNWGSGTNTTIAKMQEMGYNLLGYDIATQKIENIHNDINEIKDNSLSGIISNNYIEHMQDPIEEFSLMNSKMKQNSIMIHATPCWKYCFERTKYHLFYLENKSLNVLCEKTGFEIIEDYKIPQYPYPEYGPSSNNIKVFKKIK